MRESFIAIIFFISFLISAYSQKNRQITTRLLLGANFIKTYDEAPDELHFDAYFSRFGYNLSNEYLYFIKNFNIGIGISNSVIIKKSEYLLMKNIFSSYVLAGCKIVNKSKYRLNTEIGLGPFVITSHAKTKENFLSKLQFSNEFSLNKRISLLIVPSIMFMHYSDNIVEISNRKDNFHSHSIYFMGIAFGFEYTLISSR